MQKKYLSIAFIFISLSIFLILLQISGIKIIYHFFHLSNWETDDPNIKISLENPRQILVEGTSENKEVTIAHHFDQPVSLDLINRDAFLIRIRLAPQITNLKLRLISNHDFQQYVEWETGYESSRLGIDGSRLAEWQNYRLPIIWGKNINFDYTHVTDLVIIYYPSSPIDGHHLKISAPAVKSYFYLPWTIFFNDPRAQPINSSGINQTRLPVFYLNIPTESLIKLNSDFPQNVRLEVPADLTTPDGQKFKIAIKNRGDRENHYSYFKRSWRVTFSGNDNYQDLKRLNLVIPEKSFYGTILPYQMAQKMGLLAPTIFPARLIINGLDYGAYDLIAQIDDSLLLRNQRAKGLLFYGDIESGDQYDPLNPLFESSLHWTLAYKINWGKTDENYPLAKLIQTIFLPQAEFEKQIESILDIDSYLKWYALYQLFNSLHNDEWHNIKMFYNADSGKFEMIPWDVFPNFSPQGFNIDFTKNFINNRLTFKLLQTPKYVLALDKIYYQYGKNLFLSSFFDESINKIVIQTKNDYLNDIYLFPSLKNSYDSRLKSWKEQIINRIKKIVDGIEKSEYQICRLNSTNVSFSSSNIFLIQLDNKLIFPHWKIETADNDLVSLGIMHREQLIAESTKHVLPATSIISNPVTQQVIYQPNDFFSLVNCR